MTKSVYSGRRSRQKSKKGFFEFRYSRDRTTSAQAQMLWTLFIAMILGIGAAIHFKNSYGGVEKLAANSFGETSTSAFYRNEPAAFYQSVQSKKRSQSVERSPSDRGFELPADPSDSSIE